MTWLNLLGWLLIGQISINMDWSVQPENLAGGKLGEFASEWCFTKLRSVKPFVQYKSEIALLNLPKKIYQNPIVANSPQRSSRQTFQLHGIDFLWTSWQRK